MRNTERRTLTASLCVAVVEVATKILLISGVCRSKHPFFISWCILKINPITLCLTDFYFHRSVCNFLEKFHGKSVFYARRQSESKTRKNFGYGKVTVLVLISHFRGMLIVIFRRINCNEE